MRRRAAQEQQPRFARLVKHAPQERLVRVPCDCPGKPRHGDHWRPATPRRARTPVTGKGKR
jgi:hypothetical protein